jgi:hypothetical protein
MRRWLWRGTLAAMAVLVLLGGATTVKAFSLACDGSLEGWRYLTDVRREIREATALPPTPRPASPTPTPTLTPTPTFSPTPAPAAAAPSVTVPPTPTPTPLPPTPTPVPPTPTPPPPTALDHGLEAAGLVGAAVIGGILWVKQSDVVAYPAHVTAAHVLDVAGCGTDAVRIQWLKAGLHASGDGWPERVATGLGETASGPDDREEIRQIVRIWIDRLPRNTPMRQVQAAFDAQST